MALPVDDGDQIPEPTTPPLPMLLGASCTRLGVTRRSSREAGATSSRSGRWRLRTARRRLMPSSALSSACPTAWLGTSSRSGAATTPSRCPMATAAALPSWSIAKYYSYSPHAIAPSLKQRVHDRVHGQLLEVRVLLAHADEHDGLARLVGHRQSGSYFIVDRIELRQY